MAARRYSDAAFRAMSPGRKAQVLTELVQATRGRPNGDLVAVKSRILDFEKRIGVDAATMQRQLLAGTRSETVEVCEWLMLLLRRARLVVRSARTE